MTATELDDRAAWAVLSHYPAPVRQGLLVPLGSRGGFSGARLWRLESPFGAWCVRAWPVDPSLPSRLDFIHFLMSRARSAGLTFVPAVFATTEGTTWVSQHDRSWDVTEFLPGQADFHQQPTPARLEAGCQALAQLHCCWERVSSKATVTCPAVERRLAAYKEWKNLVQSGWRPLHELNRFDPLVPLVERAWRILAPWLERLPTRLFPWLGQVWTVQPCLCDLWHDHLLFEGEHLTGLVDYGALKVDHPAVDLARMLGSLVEDDASGWQTGLRAYRQVRPFSEREEELACVLDQTGSVLAVANWLRWLCHDHRPYENRTAVSLRLEKLVQRLERW